MSTARCPEPSINPQSAASVMSDPEGLARVAKAGPVLRGIKYNW
jgi:hypothetical protein